MAFRPVNQARPSQGRGTGLLLGLLVLMALAGGAWFAWRNDWLGVAMPASTATPLVTPATTTAAIAAQGNLIATNAALADATARLTALQQRLAELDQRAMAAAGQASRAEALLVALAVRRTVERGQPLGYLETALRVRFGDSQPTAVDQVVASALKPVTIGALTEQFRMLEPRLADGPANEGTWDWMERQLGAMFVIRHDETPSPAPASRIARARAALAGQRVDLAIAEVERMPGKDAATDWLAHARDWVATQHALDQIESAALSSPTVAPIAASPAAPVTNPPAKPQSGL